MWGSMVCAHECEQAECISSELLLQVLFNVFVFLVLLVNVLHTPRRSNSEITAGLLQEGAFVFLVSCPTFGSCV